MNQQESLFDMATAPRALTDRQATALEHLKDAGRDGLGGTELGKLMHGHTGCRFCKSTGLELLRALKAKGHARQGRGGAWFAVDLQADPTTEMDIPY